MADKQANECSNRDITDGVYERLADQLDALPNGFPRTESGVEIRLLEKMVAPEEAWWQGNLAENWSRWRRLLPG